MEAIECVLILLDDVDIRHLSVEWLRRQIGLVSQEPNLFAGTVVENIRIGKPEAELEEVEQSAKQADAHNFILNLPEVNSCLNISHCPHSHST
ncbi:unnamed protein product [Mesocestoides corti]|uniref:ABC transporter domain-containing protein n=1 Tax=Mesocestoides corti TaxID=53468 RepID=A0A0R3UD79_MESCO|nr:unnamed protein product [Mesocestoides corti]